VNSDVDNSFWKQFNSISFIRVKKFHISTINNLSFFSGIGKWDNGRSTWWLCSSNSVLALALFYHVGLPWGGKHSLLRTRSVLKPFYVSASDDVDDDMVTSCAFASMQVTVEPESTGHTGLDGPKALYTTCGDIVEPSLRFSPPRVTRIRTVGRRRTSTCHRPSCLGAAQRDGAVPLARGDATRLGTASTTHLSLSLSRAFSQIFSLSLSHSHSLLH